jgi:hypothetical protein
MPSWKLIVLRLLDPAHRAKTALFVLGVLWIAIHTYIAKQNDEVKRITWWRPFWIVSLARQERLWLLAAVIIVGAILSATWVGLVLLAVVLAGVACASVSRVMDRRRSTSILAKPVQREFLDRDV